MSETLIDITQSPELISGSFRELHEDLDYFCTHRHDKLAVSTINVIKFVVLCYDKESDVSHQYRSRWPEKKRQAALESGLSSEENQADARAILFGENEVINRVISRYVLIQFDKDWMEYIVLHEMLMNATTQALSYQFDNPTQASKAKSNIRELKNDIEALEEKMFTGGDVELLKKALAANIQQLAVRDLRPESIVTRIEKGEPVVDQGPYGDDYTVNDMHFLGDE